MQIYSLRFKPSIQEEKDCCQCKGLCLYCGEEGHLARNCKKNKNGINPETKLSDRYWDYVVGHFNIYN
jgi:hypothetical protein